ncbi:phosphodiesterase [Allorhizobium pseudoryzae]|uniref:phosphodiesterase n=1 Tax=Allorhizobium pseudoryzae TaxID=379684 RepID=UPI003D0121E9
MFKLLHLSDLHLKPPGVVLHGLHPDLQLQRCVSHILAEHADADLCIVSGDIAHDGEPLAYREARGQLKRLPMPVHVMIGNHDDRAALGAEFPEACAADGFIHRVIETVVGRMVLLDTQDPGSAEGRLCEARLAWLRARLAENDQAPVYLFAHHPPVPVGLQRMDAIRLRDAEAFMAALLPFRDRLRHLFFGHLHRAISGTWRDLPFSGVRGTSHQIALDFTTPDIAPVSFETPGYGVALIGADSIVVHHADFMASR